MKLDEVPYVMVDKSVPVSEVACRSPLQRSSVQPIVPSQIWCAVLAAVSVMLTDDLLNPSRVRRISRSFAELGRESGGSKGESEDSKKGG